MRSGFTIIELLVVASIITMGLFFTLQLRNRVLMDQTVNLFIADIRNVQFKALSSARYNGSIRCGYGIHDNYNDYNSYLIYTSGDVSALSPSGDCNTNEDRRYCRDAAPPVEQAELDEKLAPDVRKLFDSRLEFKGGINNSNFGPIFFEPPNPTTFLCIRRGDWGCPTGAGQVCDISRTDFTLPPTAITIGNINSGHNCAGVTCKSICVYTSGKIE